MKKLKLKQWYPSLPESIEVGHTVEIDSKSFSNGDVVEYYLLQDTPRMWISSKELHPDFWELIEEEKPLFITEDGVEIYTNNVKLFAVNSTFITASDNNFDFEVCKKEGWKLFFHESNADEYIWRNKPVFSYKDIQNYGVHPVNMIRVEQLAKERSEQ